MHRLRAFIRRRFRRADVHAAINLHRIHADYLAVMRPRQTERQRGFAARGRACQHPARFLHDIVTSLHPPESPVDVRFVQRNDQRRTARARRDDALVRYTADQFADVGVV